MLLSRVEQRQHHSQEQPRQYWFPQLLQPLLKPIREATIGVVCPYRQDKLSKQDVGHCSDVTAQSVPRSPHARTAPNPPRLEHGLPCLNRVLSQYSRARPRHWWIRRFPMECLYLNPLGMGRHRGWVELAELL